MSRMAVYVERSNSFKRSLERQVAELQTELKCRLLQIEQTQYEILNSYGHQIDVVAKYLYTLSPKRQRRLLSEMDLHCTGLPGNAGVKQTMLKHSLSEKEILVQQQRCVCSRSGSRNTDVSETDKAEQNCEICLFRYRTLTKRNTRRHFKDDGYSDIVKTDFKRDGYAESLKNDFRRDGHSEGFKTHFRWDGYAESLKTDFKRDGLAESYHTEIKRGVSFSDKYHVERDKLDKNLAIKLQRNPSFSTVHDHQLNEDQDTASANVNLTAFAFSRHSQSHNGTPLKRRTFDSTNTERLKRGIRTKVVQNYLLCDVFKRLSDRNNSLARMKVDGMHDDGTGGGHYTCDVVKNLQKCRYLRMPKSLQEPEDDKMPKIDID